MRAGRLRHQVTIKSQAGAEDGYGGHDGALSTDATVYANVRAVSGNELALAGAVAGETLYEVTLRYRTGISPADVLVWGSRLLEVRSVVPDERNRHVLLTCIERRAAGT